jgi:predicted small lipoprotein YifL
MKTIIVTLAALAVFSSITGCSDDPPSVRVANQRATKANVQFKQANGNTINHNDVSSGAYSNFQEVAAGAIVVTAEIQNESVSPTTTFNASNDNNYTVVILAGDPPTLRVDTQGK